MADDVIRTPDQRLRVFVSSTLGELAEERGAVRRAVERLGLAPVLFELGARPHPPRALYRAYLEQSHIFLGIYWESYGWVAPGETVSGLEDEYNLSGNRPRLIYVKAPAPGRQPRLGELLGRIRSDDRVSYKAFRTARELGRLVGADLAVLLTERFEQAGLGAGEGQGTPTPPRRSALPAPSTPLVGRGRELGELGRLLGGAARLVTLTGPGGIGKSRLALAAAGEYPDGAAWVGLAAVRDPALVLPTIAAVLGAAEQGETGPEQALLAHLRERRLLLVLDNLEHVLESAAAVVSSILAACPGVRVLATSREPLRIYGEYELPVPPLPLPDASPRLGADAIARTEAVRLFVERARAIHPGFALNPENAPTVAEICRRLDGLPLAIELAAARSRMLPPAALLQRLERGLGVLAGGARDLPERQRTLRATIAWSYELLTQAERETFRRLGAFAGGWSFQAAEAVCDTSWERGEDMLDLVGSLVEKSLVRAGEGRGGEPRFSMLQTIREYALERLGEAGETDDGRARHAAWVDELAREAAGELTGPR